MEQFPFSNTHVVQKKRGFAEFDSEIKEIIHSKDRK